MARRKLTRQFRRLNSPRPPLGVAKSYRNVLWKWLDAFNAWALDFLLDGWETNPAHDAGGVKRSDATRSNFVTRKIAGLNLALEERFAPETDLSRSIRTLAARVDKQGALEFKRTIGIPIRDMSVPEATIRGFADNNIRLIKTLAGQQIDQIRDILQAAEANALRVETLRSQIQERFDVSKSKADLLARDQTLKLNGQLTQERQTRAGISRYVWTTSKDERVRPMHEDLDGTVQSWLAPPIVSEDGRCEAPGGDYSCRCTAFPILDELDADLAAE